MGLFALDIGAAVHQRFILRLRASSLHGVLLTSALVRRFDAQAKCLLKTSIRLARPVRANSLQTPMNAPNDRDDRRRSQVEDAARAALELRVGHILTDPEWAAEQAKLVDFANILRAWSRESVPKQRGSVEVSCQREQ